MLSGIQRNALLKECTPLVIILQKLLTIIMYLVRSTAAVDNVFLGETFPLKECSFWREGFKICLSWATFLHETFLRLSWPL